MKLIDVLLSIIVSGNPQLIVVEGLIGAGKSTACKEIGELCPEVIVFHEPVDNPIFQNLLVDFYSYLAGDQTKRHVCFQMQFWLLAERYKMHKEAINLIWSEKKICLFDRSIFGDAAFMHNLWVAGHVTDSEMDIYNKMKEQMEGSLLMPHKFIWIDLEIDELMKRIKKRGRECEKDITSQYLEGLQESYKVAVLEPLEKEGLEITYYTGG